MTDWLELCRAAVIDVLDDVLDAMPTRAEREMVVGSGAGGDETTAIDKAAEDVIVARLRETGATIVSEELGVLKGSDTVVVIDPIDGSLNAKRGIPFFSLSIAVADGATMDDVYFGFVYDFGAHEEWTARRGEGAFRYREPIAASVPKDEIELLVMEATRTDLVAADAPKLVGIAHRLRIMGSTALSLCHLAAGRVDGVCTLKPTRSVDIAAAQLLCKETGMALELFDVQEPFSAAPLDLIGRSRLAAAGTTAACTRLANALRA